MACSERRHEKTLLNACTVTGRRAVVIWERPNLGDSRKYVTLGQRKEVQMGEEVLESLITLDDQGEDELEEDTFHDHKAESDSAEATA